MKVLITGAAGFIGSHLGERLLGDGHQVAVAMDAEPRISQMPPQAGDVRRTYADVSKAERLFGYRPATPFADGLHRFADWYRTEHPEASSARRRSRTIPEPVVANAR